MTETDTEVDIQEGNHAVSHRNISSPDDHPFGEDAKSFRADLKVLIRRVADDLYSSWEATIREYLANAETACLRVQEYIETGESTMFDGDLIVEDSWQPRIEVEWSKKENKLTIKDNGIGMSANTVDQVFRQIGRTTNRDDGKYAGQFGQGVLSFVKLAGLDNAAIMTTHSRINDDNASYYLTLGGVEPIQGSLPDDEYGTAFQMTPKEEFDIREAVETYAEWMRVPVRYHEYDKNGEVVFQEDWGNKALYDEYDDSRICIGLRSTEAFEAYCSPESADKTLLLSMDVDRNDGKYSPGQHGAPFSFDVRLLDESGKVIECGCDEADHEGLIPTAETDYREMLASARDPHITESMCSGTDILAQRVADGPNEGKMVVKESALHGSQPIPSKYSYITKNELSDEDEPGETEVIFGPNEGKIIVPEEEWESMDEGRAAMYVPENELSEYDIETGDGDLCLPEPTSDRDRLQSHEVFWEYLGYQFAEKFDEKTREVYQLIEGVDNSMEELKNVEPGDFAISPKEFKDGH